PSILEDITHKLEKRQIYAILLFGLERIQRYSTSIIEYPEKLKLEKTTALRKDLEKFSGGLRINSIPGITHGPNFSEASPEATIIFWSCIVPALSIGQIQPFLGLLSLINGNFPILLIMHSKKIYFPIELEDNIARIFMGETPMMLTMMWTREVTT